MAEGPIAKASGLARLPGGGGAREEEEEDLACLQTFPFNRPTAILLHICHLGKPDFEFVIPKTRLQFCTLKLLNPAAECGFTSLL